MASNIVETTEELVKPILSEHGFELADVEYVKEGSTWFLRVYIDKDGGIDINDCGIVSEQLGEKLDEADFISAAYYLEVASPGVEKPLKTKEDFRKNIGQNIFVTLYKHIGEFKQYEGILKVFNDDVLTLEYKDKAKAKEVEIPFQFIAKARIAVTF